MCQVQIGDRWIGLELSSENHKARWGPPVVYSSSLLVTSPGKLQEGVIPPKVETANVSSREEGPKGKAILDISPPRPPATTTCCRHKAV